MIIEKIAETSYQGMFKLTPSQGSSFFVRQDYISSVDLYDIIPGFELDDLQANEFLDAGLCCVVELKAISYLARCEQSRFGLTKKLTEKQFEKQYIVKALDYLESKNYLNDERFASAWLHSRKLNHYEGKSRLLAELSSRGISKEVSEKCVSEFFQENNLDEICLKAYEKFIKKGKKDEKLIAAMLQAGFTYKQIKQAKEVLEDQTSSR